LSAGEEAAFTVTRSRLDYWRGILLNAFHSRFMPLYVLAAPAVSAIFAAQDSEGGSSEYRANAIVGAAVETLALVLVVLAILLLVAAFMTWRAPGALAPIAYRFSEAGVRVRAQRGESSVPWSALTAAFEDARILIIRQQRGLVHIIPKRDIAVETLSRLRRLAHTHIKGQVRLKERPR